MFFFTSNLNSLCSNLGFCSFLTETLQLFTPSPKTTPTISNRNQPFPASPGTTFKWHRWWGHSVCSTLYKTINYTNANKQLFYFTLQSLWISKNILLNLRNNLFPLWCMKRHRNVFTLCCCLLKAKFFLVFALFFLILQILHIKCMAEKCANTKVNRKQIRGKAKEKKEER